jgi:hypothetical protein
VFENLFDGLNINLWKLVSVKQKSKNKKFSEELIKLGNETSGSIKCWETIEWLHNWWQLE